MSERERGNVCVWVPVVCAHKPCFTMLHIINILLSIMSQKVHMLRSHLIFFAENLGAMSDEQGERFHQGITSMEQLYKGFWNEGMLADYCWMLCRDEPEAVHKKYSYAQRF